MKMKEFNNTNIKSFKLKSSDCQNYPKGDTAASGRKEMQHADNTRKVPFVNQSFRRFVIFIRLFCL